MDRVATIEDTIRAHWAGGDFAQAAEHALRSYGDEIYRFLYGFHRDQHHADEVFSAFAERMWRAIPAFRWECSFRTWSYTLARNAARNHLAHAGVVRRVEQPLPAASVISAIADQVRTQTVSFLRSEVRDGIAKLRDALTEEERTLLVLRVDRELDWDDVVRVMCDGEVLDEAGHKRAAARLRKRFQTLKEKLARQAREQNLLPARR
jgi:RNA polymerase sigma-70 factor (ECF subfamily)